VPPVRYQRKHRVFRDRDSVAHARAAPFSSPRMDQPKRSPGRELLNVTHERRAATSPLITGEEEALKRRPGRVIALPWPKGWSE
jgi:hypothetical protein